MAQSKQTRFPKLADSLRDIIFAKCNPQSCEVSSTDSRIILCGGLGRMIPHTVIVLVYRFIMAHNLLMYFDTDDGTLIIH